MGVKQRGNQVGTLVAGKLESVYEARYFNCGSLKFRNSRFGGSKVFHTKGQRIFSHVAAGAGDAGSIPSATQQPAGSALVPPGSKRQMRPGRTLQRRGSIFIDGEDIGNGSRVFSGQVGLNKRETERHSLGDGKQVKLRWKLFHREKRPALERNTIDTSEWTFANHRCVMGKHFGF